LGSKAVAIGDGALLFQNFTTATDSYNVAVGMQAGKSVTTGVKNTLLGGVAGDALTDADHNVAMGFGALSSDTLGSRSVALGDSALVSQNFTTATDVYNVAVGHFAGGSVTTGTLNTFVGGLAGDALNTGEGNTALGYNALGADTKGDLSVAIGYAALVTQNFSTNTDAFNVAVGFNAGGAVTTGTVNTLLGATAGDSLETGTNNVIIGYGCDAHQSNGSNQIVIGHNITAIDNSYFSFGKASNVVSNQFSVDASWSRSSDQRLKKDITDSTLGLSFINDLRTVKHSWKASHELDSSDSELAHLYKEDEADNEMDTEATMHGFIAQEVKAALDTAGVSDFGGWKEDQYGVQQVSREMFVIPLVKAVQELSTQVTALQAEIETLRSGG